MSELFSVKDKVVLVSGGTRGIGRAIAEAFRAEGALVVVSARHAAEGFDSEVCDIRDAAQIAATVERVAARHGRIDVLFNVAGINFRHAAETFPSDKLDDILATNVRGNYLMAVECGRRMVARRSGKVINIASLHTQMSWTGVSAYGMSKGAIGSMTRALAVEWAPANVQVNAMAPGVIRTDLNAALWEKREMREFVETRTPAGRLGTPADLVGAALFLASPASDFVTGQVLYVDGGLVAGSSWPLEYPRA